MTSIRHPTLWLRGGSRRDETVKKRLRGSLPGFVGARRRAAQVSSALLGIAFALMLFVFMALLQRLDATDPRATGIEESLIAFQPPEIELKPEEPPPREEEEEKPELAAEPPQLTLDQLDLALHPGVGDSVAGEVGPGLGLGGGSATAEAEEFFDFNELDQTPRPIGVAGLNFPHRLLQKKVSGRIVLLLKLDADGKVLDAQVESSNLPEFDAFVAGEVRHWRFTPATRQGRPVKALARLPIPIRISERGAGAFPIAWNVPRIVLTASVPVGE